MLLLQQAKPEAPIHVLLKNEDKKTMCGIEIKPEGDWHIRSSNKTITCKKCSKAFFGSASLK